MTIYPPFYADHGLNLDLSERVFINQGCTFLDYAGSRLAEGVMIAPKVTVTRSTRKTGGGSHASHASKLLRRSAQMHPQ